MREFWAARTRANSQAEAYEGTNHVPAEGVRGDLGLVQSWLFWGGNVAKAEGLQVTNGCCVGFSAAEGGEVVQADEVVGGRVHGVDVNWFVECGGVACPGGQCATGIGGDAVAVVAAQGGEARVEPWGRVGDVVDADVFGQEFREAPNEATGVTVDAAVLQDVSGYVDVGYLAGGVDACVGAACNSECDWGAADEAQGVFEGSFDGTQGWLFRPAVEVCAVVGDVEAQAHHVAAGGDTGGVDGLEFCLRQGVHG